MKHSRLTVNRIAGAGIRANKRAYIALGLGIWLAVSVVCTFCLCMNGAVVKGTETFHALYGLEDIIVADTDIPDSTFTDLGLFDDIGHTYNTAHVTDTPYRFGWYDETGRDLLNHGVLEGRMPENANEIAMEISTFLSLGYTADDIGTVVALPLTPQDGTEETHTFTLVGMLNDQSSALDDGFRYSPQPGKMPSIIAGGPIRFETGRSIVHTLMTLQADLPLRDTVNSLANFGCVYGVLTGYGLICPNEYTLPLQDIYFTFLFTIDIDQLFLLLLLGGSLVVSACVGIAGALESRLAGRTEEIGMLRAVGATRRQIRRIFGRESWLLALVLSPLSVGTACLAARILSLVFPSVFAFAPDPLLLIPAFALSALCILFASSFPLRRASKQAPMGVLRDTALLRKALHVRAKPKFSVSSLLAERQIRLHPARQIGSVVLVGILCISAASAFEFSTRLGLDFDFSKQEAFEIWCSEMPYQDFENTACAISLTDADLQEIRSLPGVRQIEYSSETLLLMHTDAVPEYMLNVPTGFIDNDYLLSREQYEAIHCSDQVTYQDMIDGFFDINAKYTALQSYLGTSDTLIKIPLLIAPSRVLNDIDRDPVLDGSIHIEAIDSGSEILAVAEDRYYKMRYAPDGTYLGYESYGREIPAYDFYRRNDMFFCGDTVTLTQLLVDEDIYKEMLIGIDYPGTAEYYTQYFNCARYSDCNISVGAILSDHHLARLSYFSGYSEPPQLLTTYSGAKALGIDPGMVVSVKIYVDPDIDAETENFIAEHIRAIISRGSSYACQDNLAYSRRSQETSRQRFFALIACTLLFFCVSVAMVSGNAARRIRADARMIGTLRAVGADAKVITGCYTRQIFLQIAAGAVFSIAFSYLFDWLIRYATVLLHVPVSVPTSLLFAALCFAFCRIITGIRVRSMLKNSIIENIREL